MNNDLFPYELLKHNQEVMERSCQNLEAAKGELDKLRAIYEAAHNVAMELGCVGEINNQHKYVDAMLEAFEAYDGGRFKSANQASSQSLQPSHCSMSEVD